MKQPAYEQKFAMRSFVLEWSRPVPWNASDPFYALDFLWKSWRGKNKARQKMCNRMMEGKMQHARTSRLQLSDSLGAIYTRARERARGLHGNVLEKGRKRMPVLMMFASSWEWINKKSRKAFRQQSRIAIFHSTLSCDKKLQIKSLRRRARHWQLVKHKLAANIVSNSPSMTRDDDDDDDNVLLDSKVSVWLDQIDNFPVFSPRAMIKFSKPLHGRGFNCTSWRCFVDWITQWAFEVSAMP